ncbi:tetratricopeptide repeat protein [Pseudomonas typographi]|uniref:Tetratricopeptide repeat protein 38 n=1 Tax=Pseudomonas typographi TaxID=2715964 RepID=A0ABR7YWX7_9PSED|nr:tetratricopeptide repeat protein [Pseudomonas typographi]MBD1597680.1 tetratricopeptide repeat protein [Pseudomonas typographi]
MSQDFLGNPLDTERPDSVAAINDFIGGMLGYHPRALRILAAAEQAPESTLTNALAGILTMFDESPAAAGLAAPWLARAQAAGTGQLRAELYMQVLQAWTADDLGAVLALTEQLLHQYPHDLFAAKLNQYVEFNRGNWPALLRIGLKARAHNPGNPQALGMLAFAFEQCHLLADAEAAARDALNLQPDEPWAQHALAHVMLTEGRIDEGTEFLEAVKGGWNNLNSFMYTHNWWHLALFYLARGNQRRVLEIYDEHLWGIEPGYSQDQIGAVSMLARLELAGLDVGQRWQALAPYLAARAGDTVQPFLSVQYLYGLARAGQPQAEQLLDALRTRAQEATTDRRETWAHITLPLAEGLLAHARRQFGRSSELLALALPRLNAIGGSHAQRDLFALIELDAGLHAGDWLGSQQRLELRRRYDPWDVPTNQQLVRVYAALGLPEQAEQAQDRINQTLARHGEPHAHHGR